MGILKRRLINWVLKDLLCSVDSEKVVNLETVNDGSRVLLVNGEMVTPEYKKILKEEAAYLKRSELWSLMQNTLGDVARKTMFEKSKDWNDMMSGKLLLYALDVQKKILAKMDE